MLTALLSFVWTGFTQPGLPSAHEPKIDGQHKVTSEPKGPAGMASCPLARNCIQDETKRNCAAAPSSCGYPDQTNTGPLPGTAFVRVPQDVSFGQGWAWEPAFQRLRVSGAGAVVDSVEVHGQVVIDAPNVTLRNSMVLVCGTDSIVAIRAGRPADGYNANHAHILSNLLSCDGPSGQRSERGVSDVYGEALGLLIERNNIRNVSNGVTVEREAIVRGNFVHALGHRPGDHHSGLSTHGGATDILLDRNTVLVQQEATSAPITVYSDFAAARNVTVSRNLVSGGSYCFYGGDTGAYAPAEGRIRFLHNRLSRKYGQNDNCGAYGQVTALSLDQGSEWIGNFWDEDLRPVTARSSD